MVKEPAVAQKATNRITLCGGFSVKDRNGVVWGVKEVWIAKSGYIADVTIELDRGGALDAGLMDDEVLIGGVFRELHKIGYNGMNFERAEMGLQTDSTIVLEPGQEFDAFAEFKGFRFLD